MPNKHLFCDSKLIFKSAKCACNNGDVGVNYSFAGHYSAVVLLGLLKQCILLFIVYDKDSRTC